MCEQVGEGWRFRVGVRSGRRSMVDVYGRCVSR